MKDIATEILEKGWYWTEYQPIVDIQEHVYAYEALARFYYNGLVVQPDKLFGSIRDDVQFFYEFECAVKKEQFKNRPKNLPLFLNLDLHTFQYRQGINNLILRFARHHDFIIELVGNSLDVVNAGRLTEVFQKTNFKYAIDGYFKDHNPFSLKLFFGSSVIKLDKGILQHLKTQPDFAYVIDGVIRYAHANHKMTLLAGIETTQDEEIARNLGVDWMQGFLFKSKTIYAK